METKTANEIKKTAKPAPAEKAPRIAKRPQGVAAEPKRSVNVHAEAGITSGVVGGITGLLNANRKAKVKATDGRNEGTMTDRLQKSLYTLRDHYGAKAFEVRGLDNGIVRDLVATGLLELSGGQKTIIDGAAYMIDGATPLTAKVTTAGQKYGKL